MSHRVIWILLCLFCISTDSHQFPNRHRHRYHKSHDSRSQSRSHQWKSLLYPGAVCSDQRYWKQLPSPGGIIGYGYNAMTGSATSILLFNSSIYDESECRLAGRRGEKGVWDMYRLPSYVVSYTFYDPSAEVNSKLHFEYSLYNSTISALLDARNSRSLPFEVNGSIKYEDLYLRHKPVPIRQDEGTRTFYEAMQDLASISRDQPHSSPIIEPPAPVLYSVRASATKGEFELKAIDRLSWQHLNEKFRERLRRAILFDDFLELFDEAGTHYARAGTFGGVSERWWISRRRPERRCSQGEEPRLLEPGLMAACDHLRLVGGTKGDENGTSTSTASENCQLVNDDERFRTSRWMVSAGGPSSKSRNRMAFIDHSDHSQLQQWLEALHEEPCTVRVDLDPICDLLPLVDERTWHTERCRDQLLAYIKLKDPFYAGKHAGNCGDAIPLKFDKTGRTVGIVEVRSEGNESVRPYCLPTGPHSPERTCRANASARVCDHSMIWLLFVFMIHAIYGLIFLHSERGG